MQFWVTWEEYLALDLKCFWKHIYPEVDSRLKRAARFERKKRGWKYPELHANHPRLQDKDKDEDADNN